jgi:dTDP-glucose 4,6-dehydratase
MRILITGGCGFLGSHFVRAWLRRHRDSTIVNADCLTYAGSLDNLEDAAHDARHRHERIDVADPETVEGLFTQGFDLVVHFAAETHVDRSLEDAGQFVRTNVRGTENLLAMSGQRRAGMARPAVIVVSTDEVYGPTPDGTRFRTDAPLSPTSPYAASKAVADRLSLAYARALDLNVTIVRSVNVYGPRQYPEKVIPLFTSHAISGCRLPLYGDGLQRRSWLYVDDFVDGLMRIAGDPHRRREHIVWHLGSHDEPPNLELAQTICELCDADPALITHVADRPGHDRRYALDFTETERVFGWSPRTLLRAGLEETVGWIKANIEWCRRRTQWKPSFLRGE